MNFKPTWPAPWTALNRVLADGSLLMLRAWLGQEFVWAASHKLRSLGSPPEWFVALSLPWPLPALGVSFNWAAAGFGELLLGLALLVGWFTRWASLGLLYITAVAVYAVHFDLGWAGWRDIETEAGQGFKVPLMIALMLLVLLGHGAGRWAIDARRDR